jgi:hypothetical protein
MLLPFSLDADQPERVAKALAWIWAGEAYTYPQAAEGAWIVAGADGGALLVHPRGAAEAADVAIATHLGEAEVLALSAREGWMTVKRSRAGRVQALELWIENRFAIEVLTPRMQADYAAALAPETRRAA